MFALNDTTGLMRRHPQRRGAPASQFLLPANEVWGKVMFLHVSVITVTVGVPPSLAGGVPSLTGGAVLSRGCYP